MKRSNMVRRMLAVTLTLALSLTLLAGCGGEEETTTTETTEAVESQEVTTSAEELLLQAKEPAAAVEVVVEENTTTVVEGMGNGLEVAVGTATLDADPNRSITRSTTAIPQIRSTDMYGNPLGDEFYFHRNMLSDIGKKAYDQMYIAMVNLQSSIDMSVAVSINDIATIREAVRSDHPELIWLESSFNYSYNNQGIVTTVNETYNDLASNAGQNYANFYAIALEVCLNAVQYDQKADQVKYVNDYLCNVNSYLLNCPYNQTAYSALCTGTTVCAGYARAFQYCMQLLGIPATYITGYAGENHAWNLIELDGEVYNMDVTWNDCYPNAGEYSYDYFNITDSQISADHQRTGTSVNLPAANGTYYNYYSNFFGGNCYGSDFSNYQSVGIIDILNLDTKLANVLNGDTAYVDNNDLTGRVGTTPQEPTYEEPVYEEPTYEEPTYEEPTYEEPVYEEDDFDWDAYYEELEAWESTGGMMPAGISDGVYDEDFGDYLYYDYEYGVYYYYDYDYETYIGFDEYDFDTIYYWDLDCWYYW